MFVFHLKNLNSEKNILILELKLIVAAGSFKGQCLEYLWYTYVTLAVDFLVVDGPMFDKQRKNILIY